MWKRRTQPARRASRVETGCLRPEQGSGGTAAAGSAWTLGHHCGSPALTPQADGLEALPGSSNLARPLPRLRSVSQGPAPLWAQLALKVLALRDSQWGWWHRRAPQAWGSGRAKPTQQVGWELGGPPSIPAPDPCRMRVIFLALRTAWGKGQRVRALLSPAVGSGHCVALNFCSASFSGAQDVAPRLQGDTHMSRGGKGLAQSKWSINAGRG